MLLSLFYDLFLKEEQYILKIEHNNYSFQAVNPAIIKNRTLKRNTDLANK
ncbi:hypothetical protein BOVAC2_1344 [Bacteroides ovatus]|jgi:hypothetical protein|nr:hypothetical protein BOVAC2_1344 [Bacteroides ovatus]